MMIEYHSQWYQMGMLNIFFSFILWPGILLVEAFFYDFGMNMDISTYSNIVGVSQGIMPWSALLIGHVLFVRVLVLCSGKRSLLAGAGDSVDLLDDVLN